MYGVHSNYLKTAAFGILLTEEDVRERINLRRQNLGDVRSLSLPGLYEKITHLGNSLKKFVYLKSLDLSRNALTTLEGLKHLTYLEKLNLYFNHISSLSEVLRLHNLTALQVVDFRLNPVVKNESDYRLFVVHMLPNLKQLDDCPVTESDRKASLLRFTFHAYTFKKPEVLGKQIKPSSFIHPRVEYINSMSKKYLAVDEDDEKILAKSEWDLRKHAKICVSSKKDPEVELHSFKSVYEMKENSEKWKSEFSLPQFFLLQKKCSFQNTLSEDRNTLKEKTTNKGMNESLLISQKMVQPVQKACRYKEQRFNGRGDALKQYLNKLLKEKEDLKNHKFKVEESVQISDSADTASLQITDFEDHHQLLIDENASMKKHLQNFNKMREMTEMLQESHRTLISTNEHLLKQLNEMHLKHKAEVEQLHCNYNQLKKTMDTLSPKS
ncbi:centrosomal protein of 72 kDa isoform X3 [Erythrolamprus reginae]|uniref:centrosomal protein of 72 kDa isoform X3 n=1 Tax=Erythrolamprus reginae TaxID=121349 RepID=UPI00396C3C63